MKNIEELKQLIANNKTAPQFPGYLCLGPGKGYSYKGSGKSMGLYFDLKEMLWRYNPKTEAFVKGQCGLDNDKFYYIESSLLKMETTMEEDYIKALELLKAPETLVVGSERISNKENCKIYIATRDKDATLTYNIEQYWANNPNEKTLVTIRWGTLYAIVKNTELEVKPLYKTVKLNGTYEAKVYKDRIEVGCQTINWSRIGDLVKAHEEL